MKPGIEGLNPLDITNFYLFEGMGRNSLNGIEPFRLIGCAATQIVVAQHLKPLSFNHFAFQTAPPFEFHHQVFVKLAA